MRFTKVVSLLAATIFILSACSGQSAQEKIYEHLEKAVSLEDEFRKQQEPLKKLEEQEQELYNQIIDLSMDEFDQIKKLSKEAAALVEEREEKLKLEKESIDAAKEEFDKIKPLIEDLDEEQAEAKKIAEQLVDTMNKRYNAYQDLYEAYQKALDLDKELYEMLQQKDLTQEELQQQVKSINESYSAVIEANEQFNTYTKEYNELKKQFYEAVGLDVSYEDSAESESKDNKNKSEEAE